MIENNRPNPEDENNPSDGIPPDIDKELQEFNKLFKPETALEQAQQLAYDAMEAPTRKVAVSLARKALKISPDCADAYVILAEEYAVTIEEAIYYYKAGIEAGKRAIGAENFKKLKGHFWGILETRPYMRALFGLTECLWEVGKHREAIEGYQNLLKLNPNDNQGIRYILAARLLDTGNLEALKKLLNKYHEATAAWLYTRALVTFSEQGANQEADQQLRLAAKFNRHVIPYLTGQKSLPRRLPQYLGFGDKNEAICYVAEFGRGWLKIKGALEWFKATCNEPVRRSSINNIEGIPEVFLKAFDSDSKKSAAKEKIEDIYTFRVDLKYAPGIWRKIEIKGSQSLHHLHQAIVEAYRRDDDHLYAFFMNNKPWDNTAEYGPPYGETDARNSMKAKINSLGLQVKSKFLYIFDFGDDWEHPITLISMRQEVAKGKFPRVVGSKGEAPPQYYSQEE